MQNRPKRKNINQEILNQVFKPEGNIAFLDAEFNAGMDYRTGDRINEIISIGLVICDMDFKGIKKYYSLVKPLSKVPVFPIITEITGITTEMLTDQPNFAEVSGQIMDLIKKHGVNMIFSWGAADKHSLDLEKVTYKKKRYQGYQHVNKWTYTDMLLDISGAVSSQVLGIKGGLAINMENLMFVCGINDKQNHNALSDAMYLYECMKYLRKHYPPSNRDAEFLKTRKLVNQFYQEKSTYNSFRRFKSSSKASDLYNSWESLDAARDMRIKALEDDIKFLKGEIPWDSEFDSIQEYFLKNKEKNSEENSKENSKENSEDNN